MAFYQTFTTTRPTTPELTTLLSNLRTAVNDVTAGVTLLDAEHIRVKKATAFTAGEITAAQTAIDTTAAVTPQTAAQREIDAWPIAFRALVLALVDQINVLRAALPSPKPAITPQQALTAIRDKAATLNGGG